MSNFRGLRCPNCGGSESIDILATVWVRVTLSGTDADASACGDHEWRDQNAVSCDACGHRGHVEDFQPTEEAPQAKAAAS